MFKQLDYAMVTVSDMKWSVQFYREKLGLQLKFESSDWSEFQTGTTTLALHGGGKPKPRLEGDKPAEAHAGTCSIGFNVSNLDKAFEELKSRGVKFVMPPTVREGEGIKLAVCIDPDGLPIALAEMLHKST